MSSGEAVAGATAHAALRAACRGAVIGRGDAGYDAARRVFNASIDRHPEAVVRCADEADVIEAVAYARRTGLLTAIRGGGHNGAGLGVCDDGLVIDLSDLKGIRVDPETRTVRVGGGCRWREVNHATHPFGLVVPSGVVSTTGVGGLTLGGGIGHLARSHGLTIDSLLEVDMVLADGSRVTADEVRHPDLFWAVRGGGGNFGVVTSFLFRAHPIHTVVAGPTIWPLEDSAEVLAWYREFLPAAPEALSGFFAFMTVPPAPPFPAALHGRKACAVVWCFTGPSEEADEAFAPVEAFGRPLLHGVDAMPVTALLSAFDALYPPGHQWYWRADFMRGLSDEAVELHARLGPTMPSPQSTVHLYPMDGAVRRVDGDATAFAHRDVDFAQVIIAVDPDPAMAPRLRDWAVDYWRALHPHSAGGAYVNFMMEEGPDRVAASYRGNHARLAAVKKRYDPDNVFRVNQNIRPAP